MPRKLKETTPKINWTQRTKPANTKRSRRITLSVTPELADRLIMLARIDRVSVNHEVELMTEAEYSRRLADPAAAELIRAFERVMNPTPAAQFVHDCPESTGTPLRPFLKMKK